MYGKTRSNIVLGNYSCLRCMAKKVSKFYFLFLWTWFVFTHVSLLETRCPRSSE